MKFNILNLTLAGALAVIATAGHAIPFDDSNGTTATVVVNAAGGTGVDYTSLKQASNAFNAVATINRPWLLLVASDLAETERVAFGTNVSSGNSLTIKPAPEVAPTITFSNAAPFHTDSFYGALVIGANNDAIRSDAAPTVSSIFATNNAYIIDGSSVEGGVSRDLTLYTVADATGYIVRVVGSTNGFILKNTNLINQRPSSSVNGIGFGAGNIPGFGVDGDYKSDNVLIENNLFETNKTSGGATGIAINYSISAFGILSVPKHYEGHIVRNNIIYAKHRGISALFNVNSIYDSNEFHIAYNGVGANSGAIQHIAQRSTGNPAVSTPFPEPYTVVITNNRILDLQTSNTTAGDYGVNGIGLGGDVNARYIVHNNVITGVLASSGTTPNDRLAVGIWATSPSSKYDIQHNSINITPQPNITGVTKTRAAGIFVNNGNKTDTIIKNNLVRYNAGKGAPFVSNATGTGAAILQPANVTGNSFFQAVTGDVASPLAFIGTATASLTPHVDQAALETAGYNIDGQSVDPDATIPAWANDLSFASAPAGLATVASSTVLTDINGQTRPASGAYPGAYRIATPSAVNDWAIY